MATQAQILANRRNALRSTGPRTPEGKSTSSGNAIKHGLAGAFRVFSSENRQEFDELIADYHRTFAPTSTHERFLVEEMAQARWRLAHIRRIEVALIEEMTNASGSPDPDAALVAALPDNTTGLWIALQRYGAAAERSSYRALQQLLALRREDAKTARAAARPNEPSITATIANATFRTGQKCQGTPTPFTFPYAPNSLYGMGAALR